MRHKIQWFLLSFGGLMLFMGVGMLMLTPHPVLASTESFQPMFNQGADVNCMSGIISLQCGSQASSCKNCHEVQAKKPVNTDGTGWHESHAFGDFCVLCHGGNEQATEEDAAHVGMVPPLSDVKVACQQCHPDDLMDRAQVYATKLNVSLTDAQTAPTAADPTSTPSSAAGAAPANQQEPTVQPTAVATVSSPTNNEVVVNDPNTVDYVQRYNEIVLGQRPVNWGNIILVVLIGVVVVAGGGFILFNELRLRLPAGEARVADGTYPSDVVEMLPTITRLKLQTRQTLQHLLSNPARADKVLNLVDTLVSDDKSGEQTT